jgi:hypothetical protein
MTMGIICVVLAVVALAMCVISLCWDGTIIVNYSDSSERGHALFHLLKTAVVVPALVTLLFVFGAHLRCNDKDSTWEVRNHGCPSCPTCQDCPKSPPKAEAECPQGR